MMFHTRSLRSWFSLVVAVKSSSGIMVMLISTRASFFPVLSSALIPRFNTVDIRNLAVSLLTVTKALQWPDCLARSACPTHFRANMERGIEPYVDRSKVKPWLGLSAPNPQPLARPKRRSTHSDAPLKGDEAQFWSAGGPP